MRAVQRDLRGLDKHERELAMDWYTAVEDRWTEFSLPSRIGTALQFGMLGATFPGGDLDPSYPAAALATKFGYAARLIELERASDLPAWADEVLRPLVPRTPSGAINYDGLDGTLTTLLEYIHDYASEPETFSQMANCDVGLWNAMTSIACWTFHKNVRKNRWGDTSTLALSDIDYLMRIGYVVRCIDEALGETPRTTVEVESEASGNGRPAVPKRKRRPTT